MALAHHVARRDITDMADALRELRHFIEIAEETRRTGRAPSNLGTFVDGVVARATELSDRGEFADAAKTVNGALAEEAARRAEGEARILRLLSQGERQDLLNDDAAGAADKIVRRETMTTEPAALFARLRAVQDEWYVNGRDQGLYLDLDGSIELALAVPSARPRTWMSAARR